jgi:hypothetical protein
MNDGHRYETAPNRRPAKFWNRNSAMRKTEVGGWMQRGWPQTPMRVLRLAAVALGIGMVMTAGVARAQDNDDDDKTFEEKIIDGIMAGVGATNMENRGIDYRERSPLVVPPRIDLPPPATASSEVKTPNWPKDPDEARRKAAIALRKKENKDPLQYSKPLMPDELNAHRTAPQTGTARNDPVAPGAVNDVVLSPSQLGFDGRFGSLFGGNKAESAPFKGEPTRDSLTQPPAGYQTPSPNFPYGTGPKESLNKPYNPVAGQYGD